MAAISCGTSPDALGLSNPITGIAGCCARAASGHGATAPPSTEMNSRRLITTPSRRNILRPQTGSLEARLHGEPIERGRVLHQNKHARRGVWRPFGEQVEEDRIVRLLLLSRMWPVARPYNPLWRSFNVGPSNRNRVGIAGCPDLAILICAGQLDPGLALVDELADRLEARTVQRIGLRETAKVIEHNWGRNAQQQILDPGDLLTFHVNLDMPAEIVYPF